MVSTMNAKARFEAVTSARSGTSSTPRPMAPPTPTTNHTGPRSLSPMTVFGRARWRRVSDRSALRGSLSAGVRGAT
jgi:hypothetical protein